MSDKDLGYGISLIDAEYLNPGVAAVYLLQHNRHLAIIETGTARSTAQILAVIKNHGLSPDDVDYIIPTHVHLDHAGGAGELMHHCHNATLVIHPYGAKHMIDPSRLVEGTIAVYGEENFHRLYGDLRPVPEKRVIEAPDNFELDMNGRILKFLDTPGHARHHFCIYDQTSQGIFTGDTFGLCYRELDTNEGPFIFPTTTPVQFDPVAMIESIDRLLSLEPKQMYLTHFGKIEPTQELVNQLKERIKTFSQIALEEKDSGQSRQVNIEQRLMTYLLEQLASLGCNQSVEFCQNVIRNDVKLNAQGLDVWLDRNA